MNQETISSTPGFGTDTQSNIIIPGEGEEKLTFFNKIRAHIAEKKVHVVFIVIVIVALLVAAGFLLISSAGKAKTQYSVVRLSPTIQVTPANSKTPTATSAPAKRKVTVPIKTIIPTLAPSHTPIPSPTTVPTSAPTSTPLPTPTPTLADTQAPVTNITYPQQNGEITYFISSQVCVIMSSPNDNVTAPGDITTFYAFDSDPYSSIRGTGYLCKSSMLNGTHMLRYKSQDRAGNMEAERIWSFNVNIPGNTLPTSTPEPTVTYATTPIETPPV